MRECEDEEMRECVNEKKRMESVNWEIGWHFLQFNFNITKSRNRLNLLHHIFYHKNDYYIVPVNICENC